MTIFNVKNYNFCYEGMFRESISENYAQKQITNHRT